MHRYKIKKKKKTKRIIQRYKINDERGWVQDSSYEVKFVGTVRYLGRDLGYTCLGTNLYPAKQSYHISSARYLWT